MYVLAIRALRSARSLQPRHRPYLRPIFIENTSDISTPDSGTPPLAAHSGRDATLGLAYIPDCLEPDAITFSLEWPNANSSSFTWVIRDETGYKWYEGVEAVIPNDCLPIGLTWKKIQEYNY